ncbi:MAG: thiamine pyrophosphate-binding protein [Solirubrobacteraceae bacterium]|nr:thiamine pyrophosphate-binding protein [Solirubrobacteraceae bacterium]
MLTPTHFPTPSGTAADAASGPDAISAATYLVDLLRILGVEYVFGVPGGAIEPLTDALAVSERAGGPRFVVARHEAGAAFMAEGYARATGNLGVCCATSGPGATNLLTGVACAFENGVPMLAITGQPAIPLLGKRSLQESSGTGVDVIAMFKSCTRSSSLVSHPAQVEGKVTAAVLRALQAPRGPVHLSFPVDVLRAPVERQFGTANVPRLAGKRGSFDPADVDILRDALADSKKTVFVLGRGCQGAVGRIMAVIEASGAPFVVTPDAKGLVRTDHRGYRGVLGFAGHASALAALSEDVELVVLVGSTVSEWTSAAWNPVLLSDRLIHVDDDPEHFLYSPMARQHLLGNIGGIFSALAHRVAPGDEADAASHVAVNPATSIDVPLEGAGPVKPQHLVSELSDRMPAGTRFIADAGNSTAWAVHWLRDPGRATLATRAPGSPWLHVLTEFAPMGWAIGASVGLARADAANAVVCLTGDGSYLMNGQEITVAAQERLPVIFVILNDSALGMVKHGQRLAGAEQTAFALPQIDYRRLAQSLGIQAHLIQDLSDLQALDLEELARRDGPTLLDVRIDGEEVPPMALRLQTLNEVNG